jgi:hypothetical protein
VNPTTLAALDRLREGHRSTATCSPQPPAHDLPRFVRDPERWLDPATRFPVYGPQRCRRAWAGTPRLGVRARASRRKPRSRSTTASRCSTSARRTACTSGASAEPAQLLCPIHAPRGSAVAEDAAGVLSDHRSGIDEIVTLVLGPRPRGRVGRRPRSPTTCGARPSATPSRRAQPQHQLHQRVHLQVQVLRLLEGSRCRSTCRGTPYLLTLDDIAGRVAEAAA